MALILLKENSLMLSPYCCLLQEVHVACYVKLSGASVSVRVSEKLCSAFITDVQI